MPIFKKKKPPKQKPPKQKIGKNLKQSGYFPKKKFLRFINDFLQRMKKNALRTTVVGATIAAVSGTSFLVYKSRQAHQKLQALRQETEQTQVIKKRPLRSIEEILVERARLSKEISNVISERNKFIKKICDISCETIQIKNQILEQNIITQEQVDRLKQLQKEYNTAQAGFEKAENKYNQLNQKFNETNKELEEMGYLNKTNP